MTLAQYFVSACPVSRDVGMSRQCAVVADYVGMNACFLHVFFCIFIRLLLFRIRMVKSFDLTRALPLRQLEHSRARKRVGRARWGATPELFLLIAMAHATCRRS